MGEKMKHTNCVGPSDQVSPSGLHPKTVHKFTAQMGEGIDDFTR